MHHDHYPFVPPDRLRLLRFRESKQYPGWYSGPNKSYHCGHCTHVDHHECLYQPRLVPNRPLRDAPVSAHRLCGPGFPQFYELDLIWLGDCRRCLSGHNPYFETSITCGGPKGNRTEGHFVEFVGTDWKTHVQEQVPGVPWDVCGLEGEPRIFSTGKNFRNGALHVLQFEPWSVTHPSRRIALVSREGDERGSETPDPTVSDQEPLSEPAQDESGQTRSARDVSSSESSTLVSPVHKRPRLGDSVDPSSNGETADLALSAGDRLSVLRECHQSAMQFLGGLTESAFEELDAKQRYIEQLESDKRQLQHEVERHVQGRGSEEILRRELCEMQARVQALEKACLAKDEKFMRAMDEIEGLTCSLKADCLTPRKMVETGEVLSLQV